MHVVRKEIGIEARVQMAKCAVKYHLAENYFSYKHEIKSKTVGLHQNTDITDLF